MIQSRRFVAAAILLGLALIVMGFLVAPFNASARAAAGQADTGIAADRIGGAFAMLPGQTADAALTAAVARVAKGDLAIPSNCADAVWPNIDASCLSKADGSPAAHVRSVTVGYQADQNTTVLVRVPSSEVVQR